jgi:hypothetical protein
MHTVVVVVVAAAVFSFLVPSRLTYLLDLLANSVFTFLLFRIRRLS